MKPTLSPRTFSMIVTEVARRKDWNQTEMAKYFDISSHNISRWMNGTQEPDPRHLPKLAALCKEVGMNALSLHMLHSLRIVTKGFREGADMNALLDLRAKDLTFIPAA